MELRIGDLHICPDEKEAYQLLSEGYSTKEISVMLKITTDQVERRHTKFRMRGGYNSKAHALAHLVKQQIINPK